MEDTLINFVGNVYVQTLAVIGALITIAVAVWKLANWLWKVVISSTADGITNTLRNLDEIHRMRAVTDSADARLVIITVAQFGLGVFFASFAIIIFSFFALIVGAYPDWFLIIDISEQAANNIVFYTYLFAIYILSGQVFINAIYMKRYIWRMRILVGGVGTKNKAEIELLLEAKRKVQAKQPND